MLDPPTRQLTALLDQLGLCRPRDLRRCRGRVRRLAHDLPAFDSVWIDALVQSGRLTPWQARMLESGRADDFRIGPCLLVEELGHGGSWGHTYAARHLQSRTTCVVKLLQPPADQFADRLLSLQQLVQDCVHHPIPGLCSPQAVIELDGRLAVVSRFAEGPSLKELLIRRGRFPGGVVLELLRQATTALAELEKLGHIHGQLRLSRIRLPRHNRAIIVDAGLQPTRLPVSLHEALHPEHCDGIAPETASGERPADVRSDLYGLGCLVWHLLAGRPAFPHGDPLACLAAHRSRRVPDIRQLAPETPELLADAIDHLTAIDPDGRPESFRALAERIGPSRHSGRRQLRRFKAQFDQLARQSRPGRTAVRRAGMAAAILLTAGVAVGLTHQGGRNHLLALSARLPGWARFQAESAAVESSAADTAAPDVTPATIDDDQDHARQPIPLPIPNGQGVILLQSDQVYRPSQVSHVQQLRVVCRGSSPAVLIVQDQPLRLAAPEIILDNVHIVGRDRPGRSALALMECDRLTVRRTAWTHTITSSLPPPPQAGQPSAIAWRPLEETSQSPREIAIHDSRFERVGTAVYLSVNPDSCGLQNILVRQAACLLHLPAATDGDVPLFDLQELTLRDTRSLLRLRVEPSGSSLTTVHLQNAVAELHPDGALVELIGPPDSRTDPVLRVSGVNSICGQETRSLQWQSEPGPTADELIQIEGLTTSPLSFAGPVEGSLADQVLTDFEAPPRFTADQQAAAVPGVRIEQLPLVSAALGGVESDVKPALASDQTDR